LNKIRSIRYIADTEVVIGGEWRLATFINPKNSKAVGFGLELWDLSSWNLRLVLGGLRYFDNQSNGGHCRRAWS
jgi:hypothetical protein